MFNRLDLTLWEMGSEVANLRVWHTSAEQDARLLEVGWRLQVRAAKQFEKLFDRLINEFYTLDQMLGGPSNAEEKNGH
jgi:hypothetical protein